MGGYKNSITDIDNKVGINNSNPAVELDIDGDVYVRNGHSLSLDTIAGYSTNVISLNASTNFIIPSGNVGIGTSSPASGISSNQTVLEIAHNNIPALAINDTGGSKFTIYSSGGSLSFHDLTNGAERIKILSSGGITFNGDNSTANALDDYEEGTFTVTNAGDATGTIGGNTGEYTKIGNLVFVRIVASITANFTSTNIGGLPFTVKGSNATSSYYSGVNILNNSSTNLVATPIVNQNIVSLFSNNSVSSGAAPTTSMTTLRFSFQYFTD